MMDDVTMPKLDFDFGGKNIAVILAGGFGTRLQHLTKDMPKPMIPLLGKPILEHLILHLQQYGVDNIILSVGYCAQKIIDHFGKGNKFGVNIQYSLETEPLGTGGAVKKIAQRLKDDFILLWGDNLCDIDVDKLLSTHRKHNSPLTMTLVEREDTENFGVAVVQNEQIIGFVEKPKREDAPSQLINAGIFVMSPSLLESLPDRCSIEKELFEKIVKKQKISYYSHPGKWLPTDTPEKLELARLKW